MLSCASVMDLHTPASSGYIHKAPAGNQSAKENKNLSIHCLIVAKTQTHTFSFCPLPLTCFLAASLHIPQLHGLGQIQPTGMPLIKTCYPS